MEDSTNNNILGEGPSGICGFDLTFSLVPKVCFQDLILGFLGVGDILPWLPMSSFLVPKAKEYKYLDEILLQPFTPTHCWWWADCYKEFFLKVIVCEEGWRLHRFYLFKICWTLFYWSCPCVMY